MSFCSSTKGTLGVYAFIAVNLLTACPRDPEEPSGADGGTEPPGSYKGDGGSDPNPNTVGECSKSSDVVQVQNIDKLDLLLMVDNSNSMAGEQRSLKAQFPTLIRTLTTGARFDGDPSPFPPIKDMHVGVVSSDMGIAGVDFPPSCRSDGGDDGKLQSTPRGDGCDAQYPMWLSYIGDSRIGPQTDPMKFANDIGCIAMLGTGGCGFEQQLESPFKALMPKVLMNATGNMIQNPYQFIATDLQRTTGRGDMPVSQGGNAGFLRSSNSEGLSVVAIVVITDEEDCSVGKTEHLAPNNQLPEDSPYRMEDVNLRCYKHKEFLYDIQQRYLQGFRALRPGHEDLVVFAAIVGVPTDLVSQQVLASVAFDDAAQRDQFYANILNDPRMQEQIDPSTMPGSGNGNLKPSCVRTVQGEDKPATAFPPRRLVELAKLFGENGIVQSICQDDFGPAISTVVDIISRRLGESCLARKLARRSDGLVPCSLTWELPAQPVPGAPTPTACSELPFLSPVDQGQPSMNASGGVNCKVKQLPVSDPSGRVAPPGEGWFYDDFTDETARSCTRWTSQRIAFSQSAKPPTGVTVKLDCSSPFSRLAPSMRTDLAPGAQPSIGDSCARGSGASVYGDAACERSLVDGTLDTSMFCHPGLDVCALNCNATADCPNGWQCDSSQEALIAASGRAYCVDPKCTR